MNGIKTILITGGAGFMGSNFLRYLFTKYPDYYFLVLDALTYAGNLENIPDEIRKSGRFEFWYGDVTNPGVVGELMRRSDLVVHFAAETHVERSIYDNSKFFHTDVIGTQVMMNALARYQDRVERMIHISTSEVYGNAEAVPMTETHPLNPRSPYAGAKAGADRLVYSYWTTYHLPVTIVRPFNNYGPNQHLEKVIPRFITRALQNLPLTVHGSGESSRDWLFVQDCCRGIDAILHAPLDTVRNQVFNLGTGEDYSIKRIAEIVVDALGKPRDLITMVADRPGQVQRHVASIDKVRHTVGWSPQASFGDGLARTIAWYQSNEPWWRKIEWMSTIPVMTPEGKIELH